MTPPAPNPDRSTARAATPLAGPRARTAVLSGAVALAALGLAGALAWRSPDERGAMAATTGDVGTAAGAPAARPAPATPAGASPADAEIARAEAALRTAADRPEAHVALATAFMNKARETADGSYYRRAEAAAAKALALAPDDYGAARLQSWIYAGQHRFAEARTSAERALARKPDDPFNYGTLADALIELGEYDAATEAVQKMVDLGPGTGSYARVSYIRELYGETEGAIEIMRKAADASTRDPEPHAWCRAQLGHLLFDGGRLAEAEEQYRIALHLFPTAHGAMLGLGRVFAAQERSDDAVAAYRRSLALAPTLDAAIELGDLLVHLGRADEAREPFALLAAIERLNGENGVQPDAQMALFHADHGGDLPAALALAQEQAVLLPNIRSDEALAWVLHRSGRDQEALAAIERALRLGTRHARLHYRAGMIHAALGHDAQAAEALERALAINPHFHPAQAAEARDTLARLAARGGKRS
jgi:tetratricopeptide (TPR) repeat protein